MAKTKTKTKTFKDAFSTHGVVAKSMADENGIGDCPFCGRRERFYFNVENGKWDCKVCGLFGNLNTFLYEKAIHNSEKLINNVLMALVQDRGLSVGTLKRWGIGYDGVQYTLPIFSHKTHNACIDLKRFRLGGRLYMTPKAHTGLVNAGSIEEYQSKPIYVCEGEWDAMALDECLRKNKNICPVVTSATGAGTFRDDWLPLFDCRDVVLVFDNDPAGLRGMRKVYSKLNVVANKIEFLLWEKEVNYQDCCIKAQDKMWKSKLPEGFDFRDLYKEHGKQALSYINSRLQTDTTKLFPDTLPGKKKPKKNLKPIAWDEMIKHYREWLLLSSIDPLLVLYGAIVANRLPGEPLWLFLIAPPGGSKSELLMSLQHESIYKITTLTPRTLISGANGPNGSDPSLIPKLDGKVLVIKDFTSILSMPITSREEILGIFRDAYDGEIQKDFGNGIRRNFHSKFGIIAGVTPAIYHATKEHSMLGERFLRYRIRIPGNINIGSDIITKALSNLSKEDGMRKALNESSERMLSSEIDLNKLPKLDRNLTQRIISLAQLISALRGVVPHEKYTGEVLSKPIYELGTRLAKQLTKLAFGICLIQGKTEITDAVFDLIGRVALDTIPDRTEEIIKQMYLRTDISKIKLKHRCKECEKCKTKICCTSAELSKWTKLPEQTINTILADLLMLRIIERPKLKTKGLGIRWNLSYTVKSLVETTGIYEKERKWKNAL